jgi:hypothetical protein
MDLHGENIQLCYVCDERIRANPFTRTVGDECFLYCSNDCLHKHFYQQNMEKRLQGRLNFDVVAG